MNADASIVIRKCTLAPIVAALLLIFFYATCPEIFGSFASLLFLVAWASVAAKRHTVQQFIIGALIPPMAMGLVQFVLFA